jgi:hypothetical protein
VTEEHEIDFKVDAPRWAAGPVGWLLQRLGARRTATAAGEEWKLEKQFGAEPQPGSQRRVPESQEDRP